MRGRAADSLNAGAAAALLFEASVNARRVEAPCRGRGSRQALARRRRRTGRDPEARKGGGLAERERRRRRRRTPLRSRPSTLGYLRPFCSAIADASKSPVMNMWLYAPSASVYACL